MKRTVPAKLAWARGCLGGGVLSCLVGIAAQMQEAPWSGRPVFPDDLDSAIGPMTGILWALAARIGIVAFALAAILFAAGYWLSRPPRRHET